MASISLPSNIPKIKDRESFLNLFYQAAWTFAIAIKAEYILFAKGCFAAPTPQIQARCDAQKTEAMKIDIIHQGMVDLATSPGLMQRARRLSTLETPPKVPPRRDGASPPPESAGHGRPAKTLLEEFRQAQLAELEESAAAPAESATLAKLPSGAYGNFALQTAMYRFAVAAAGDKAGHLLASSVVDPGADDCGQMAFKMLFLFFAPNADTDIADVKQDYNRHLDNFDLQTPPNTWFLKLIALQEIKAVYRVKEADKYHAVLDALAKIKAASKMHGVLGDLVLTFKARLGRDGADFDTIYLQWLKELHDIELLQARPATRALKATDLRNDTKPHCSYCFAQTGKRFHNHAEGECRRKVADAQRGAAGPTTTAPGKPDKSKGPYCDICDDHLGHKTRDCPLKAMMRQAAQMVGQGAVAQASISDPNTPAPVGGQYSSVSDLYLHLATSALTDSSGPSPSEPPDQYETVFRFRVPPAWRNKINFRDKAMTMPGEIDFKIPRRVKKRARPPSPEREHRGKTARANLREALIKVLDAHLSGSTRNKGDSQYSVLHALLARTSGSAPSTTTRSTIDSGASTFMTNNRACLGPCKPVWGAIEVADGRILEAPMLEGPVQASPLPSGLRGLYSDKFEHTLVGVCPLVFDARHAVILSREHGFFAQPDGPSCPICHPHPARFEFDATPTSLSLDLHPVDQTPDTSRRHLSSREKLSGARTAFLGQIQEQHAHILQGKERPQAQVQEPQEQHARIPQGKERPQAQVQEPQAKERLQAQVQEPQEQHAHILQGKARPQAQVQQPQEKPRLQAPAPEQEQEQEPGPGQLQAQAQEPGHEHTPAAASVHTQTEPLPRAYTEWLEIWHTRLGGAPLSAIVDLARRFPNKLKPPPGIFKADLSRWRCHCCTRAAMKRNTGPPAIPTPSTLAPLEEIHFDLFFFHETIVLFLIDRASRARWCYFLESKDEVPLKLQQFIIDVNTASFPVGSFYYTFTGSTKHDIKAAQVNEFLTSKGLPQRVKILFSDNAGEQTQPLVQDFMRDLGIKQFTSITECQFQNALAENGGGWGVTCRMRHDMSISNLPAAFAKHSFSLNTQRGNYLAHSALAGASPFSVLYPNREPPLDLFKPFGCHATILKLAKSLSNKTVDRGVTGVYLDTALPYGQVGYLLWIPSTKQLVRASHVRFDERYFPYRTRQPRILDFFAALPDAEVELPPSPDDGQPALANVCPETSEAAPHGERIFPAPLPGTPDEIHVDPVHDGEALSGPPSVPLAAPLTPLSTFILHNLQQGKSELGTDLGDTPVTPSTPLQTDDPFRYGLPLMSPGATHLDRSLALEAELIHATVPLAPKTTRSGRAYTRSRSEQAP